LGCAVSRWPTNSSIKQQTKNFNVRPAVFQSSSMEKKVWEKLEEQRCSGGKNRAMGIF
jgi:hypothetical protein